MDREDIKRLLAYYIWLETKNENSLHNWNQAEQLVAEYPSINEAIINDIINGGYTFDKYSIKQYFTDTCPICFEVKVLTNFQCDPRHRSCLKCILESRSNFSSYVKCFFCRTEQSLYTKRRFTLLQLIEVMEAMNACYI